MNPDSHLIETPLASELIYDGKIVHLYRDTVTLPNGSPALREVIRHVGAVCVVPLTDEGEVICVRQFRYPHAKVILEIPAGKLDSKEISMTMVSSEAMLKIKSKLFGTRNT